MSSLNPRDPLVFDIRDLGRRAGAMITQTRTVPAPADLGSGLAQVPAGSPLQVDVRFEAVIEGVLASGTAQCAVTAECARCLQPCDWPETVAFSQLYVHELGEDEELPVLDGDLLDLEPEIRDAVVLALPLAPLCDPGCPGLCIQCGEPMTPGHVHETIDPRWAGLAGYPATEPPTDPVAQ